jgi:outer membrane scaffolding protein for murein synthesis (MipA/OmpV family)
VLNSPRLAGWCALSLLLATFFLPAPARAEMKPKWELGFGFAGIGSPDYRGSDESRGYLLPLPYIIYHGDILRVDRNGIYGRLVESERVRLDISFDAGVPVDSTRNRARQDMPDLDTLFEIGPSLEFCLWNRCGSDNNLEFRIPLRAVFSTDFGSLESRGGLFNPHFTLDLNNVIRGPMGRVNVSASTGPLYATERYHDYYYQVDPVYATPTRPAYDARAGYSGWRVTLTTSFRHRRLWFGAFARYDDLQNAEFVDSPLMRQRHSFMAGFGIAWVMAESKELVDVRD